MKLDGNFVCPSCGKGIHVDAEYDSGKPTLVIDIKAIGPDESNELELEEMEESITSKQETEIVEEEEDEETEEEEDTEMADEEEPEEDVHY